MPRIALKHNNFGGNDGTKHGTRRRYVEGCRCEDCTKANRLYFRQRRAADKAPPPAAVVSLPAAGASQGGQFFTTSSEPGPVEVAVETELGGLTDARPGLAQAALAMARILDNARAVNQQPAAAKVLVALLDRLHSASGQNRRGGLASVRAMSSRGLDT